MKADRILAALPLTEAHRARLRAAAPWAQFRFAETPAPDDVRWADIIFGNVPVEMIRQNDHLAWFQSNFAGPDAYLAPGVLPENCLAAAAMLRREHDLDREAASGVVWWRRRLEQLEMVPVVHVRDAGTDFLEGACGSGALALALALYEPERRRRLSIVQPSGGILEAEILRDGDGLVAEIDGDVLLVAQGRVWLPDGGDGAAASPAASRPRA